MTRDLHITVQGDKLTIESGKRREEVANQIGINAKNLIFSIGSTQQEWSSQLDGSPQVIEYRFVPILDIDALIRDPLAEEIALAGIKFLSMKIGAWRIWFRSFGTLALTIDFPGYETLPAKTREILETDLQLALGPLDLQINSQAVGTPARTARIAMLSFDVVQNLPYVVILGYLAAVRTPIFGAQIPAGVALGLMLVTVILLYPITYLLWLLAMKPFVPARLLGFMFASHIRDWIIRKWYARLGARLLGGPDDLFLDPSNPQSR